MDFDLNTFLRESIGDINWWIYDLIVRLSAFFPWLMR